MIGEQDFNTSWLKEFTGSGREPGPQQLGDSTGTLGPLTWSPEQGGQGTSSWL